MARDGGGVDWAGGGGPGGGGAGGRRRGSCGRPGSWRRGSGRRRCGRSGRGGGGPRSGWPPTWRARCRRGRGRCCARWHGSAWGWASEVLAWGTRGLPARVSGFPRGLRARRACRANARGETRRAKEGQIFLPHGSKKAGPTGRGGVVRFPPQRIEARTKVPAPALLPGGPLAATPPGGATASLTPHRGPAPSRGGPDCGPRRTTTRRKCAGA